jgi:hypothetical protein
MVGRIALLFWQPDTKRAITKNSIRVFEVPLAILRLSIFMNLRSQYRLDILSFTHHFMLCVTATNPLVSAWSKGGTNRDTCDRMLIR